MGKRDWPLQVFYDGACPMCSREMGVYRKWDTQGHMEFVDIAGKGFVAEAYGLDAKRVQEVMHVRTADGKVVTELGAFVKIWEALPGRVGTTLLRWVFKVPGMMKVGGVGYRVFVRNRMRLGGRCTGETCGVDGEGG